MRKGFFIIVGVWLAISCQEIKDCELESSREFAIVRFYRADTSVQVTKEVAFSLVTDPQSEYYISSTADTIDDDTVRVMGLWLNPQGTEVNYVMTTDSIDYELKILYTPHLRIYYDECDPVYSFKLDSVYSPNFDSVAIANRVLDLAVPTNVEVYF
ncbi:hypothetical protein [Marinoscillum sp.]|uniref:hypothetical protein n=1 Tax=Marinoscillum sp. TaxID=2024838 RepID=UPI003BAC9DB5